VGDRGRFCLIRRAQTSSDPGEQLGKAERFREVVVRSGFKVGHAVRDGVLGGQDDDRDAGASFAHSGQDLLSADRRQEKIEDDEVELGRARESQALGPVAGGPDGEPLCFEPPLDEGGDLGFVLNDQHIHRHRSTPRERPKSFLQALLRGPIMLPSLECDRHCSMKDQALDLDERFLSLFSARSKTRLG
jgi:hypothetical protein